MVNPAIGTNDVMAKVYDDLMFHGATYADLKKNGSPIVWIGATDISYGRVFTFSQDTFDYLCTDLNSFPLAKAVAASNGFPIIFWPIAVKNYADQCHGYRPSWLDRKIEGDGDTAARRRLLAEAAEDYLSIERTKYVHLADGGIADNLALRGLLNAMIEFSDDPKYLQARHLENIRRVVVISVDGESAQNVSLAQEPKVTGFGTVLGAVSGTMIDKYNFETLSLAREQVAEFVVRLKKLRCGASRFIQGHPCDDVKGYVLHFALSEIKDEAVRKRLQSIPTGLTIADEDVDALVAAGEAQVKASPEIANVIKVVQEKPSVPMARRR
jgi:NTE family protein